MASPIPDEAPVTTATRSSAGAGRTTRTDLTRIAGGGNGKRLTAPPPRFTRRERLHKAPKVVLCRLAGGISSELGLNDGVESPGARRWNVGGRVRRFTGLHVHAQRAT